MSEPVLLQESLTRSIIGAFFEVHRCLGHGFLEHLYVTALERELRWRGHQVSRELAVMVMYKGETLGMHRMDMVVDDLVVVEAKATVRLAEQDPRQLQNYLRCTRFEVGLLLHFGPKARFHRKVCENRLKPGGVSVTSVPSVNSASPSQLNSLSPRIP